MNNFWKEIWDSKGQSASTDLYYLDGCDHLQNELNSADIFNEIVGALNVEKGESLLEVGCGAGFLSREFVGKYEYRGVDYSSPIINKHKELFPNHNVVCAEANKLPFEENQFDYVFCFGVFQYLPNEEYVKQTIAEMRRVAVKGVLLGDLKETSTRPQHLPCPKGKIEDLGFKILDPFYASDDCSRYNAILGVV